MNQDVPADRAALDASIQANIDHLYRLARKRDKIDEAIGDAYDAFIASVSRAADLTPSDGVALYEFARDLRPTTTPQPHSRLQRLAETLGYTIVALQRWSEDPESIPDGAALTGTFPIAYQTTPRKGVPCVYVLYADGTIIYVGRSQSVKVRLKTHWAARKDKPGLDAWAVFPCNDQDEAVRLERDLIARYAPRHNKAGNPFRSVA